ncbi:hypothetical protein QIG43_27695, partial [Klebsiella pneumoniae]|nr:hypothetical protein [Klebsiella pneumoniae]
GNAATTNEFIKGAFLAPYFFIQYDQPKYRAPSFECTQSQRHRSNLTQFQALLWAQELQCLPTTLALQAGVYRLYC